VSFDLDLSDRAVDLVEEGFDLAVRIGEIGQKGMVSRRLGTTELICCAAPAYLARHTAPQTPADLERHECIAYAYAPIATTWSFEARDGTRHSPRIAPRHRTNNGRMIAALAAGGLGVVVEPDFIVAPDIRAGRLVRLLPEFQPPRSPIAAVYPSRRHLSAKVRAFVDFLAGRFARDPEWSLASALQRPG
jgi:DNA-binding transcriptional LysR family regulator